MNEIRREFLTVLEDLAESTGVTVDVQEDPVAASQAILTRRLSPQQVDVLQEQAKRRRERYIVAPPPFRPLAGPGVEQALQDVRTQFSSPDILVKTIADRTQVLRLSAAEAALLRERYPAILVEQDLQFHHAAFRSPVQPMIDPIAIPATGSTDFSVTVQGQGRAIPGAVVTLRPRGDRPDGYRATTDLAGQAHFQVRRTDTVFARVTVEPPDGFWARSFSGLTRAHPVVLNLDPLTVDGFGWGPQATGATALPEGGQGVRVAVVDSGIGVHSSLRVQGGHNFIAGEAASAWANDEDGHGTHCAGVISAMTRRLSTWGYVPGAELYAARIFGGADGGGYLSDTAAAIDWAVAEGCDVINLSLGLDTVSGFVRQALERAAERGVLCVAAAGNTGREVLFPARLPSVLAVSAIGQRGTYPATSLSAEAVSDVNSADGQYYLAAFSGRGPEIDVCAPGVAIASTLPGDAFAAWDGTSMACPHIVGIAALTLAADQTLLHAERDQRRWSLWRDQVLGLCVDLGLGRDYQGSGLPQLSRLQVR